MHCYVITYYTADKEWRSYLAFFRRILLKPPPETKQQKAYQYLGRYDGGFPVKYPAFIGMSVVQENDYYRKYEEHNDSD